METPGSETMVETVEKMKAELDASLASVMADALVGKTEVTSADVTLDTAVGTVGTLTVESDGFLESVIAVVFVVTAVLTSADTVSVEK